MDKQIAAIVERQGWSTDSLLTLTLEYVDQRGLTGDLTAALTAAAAAENENY